MRIQKPGTQGQQEITSAKGKTDKNDRFSKILEEKRKESAPQFNLLAQTQDHGTPAASNQAEKILDSAAPPDLEHLAAEIVDHVSSHQANGTRSVEIQFNSQTLEGLRVSVRSDQGQIAVNFQTPVARIAGLLQNNLSSLRAALEDKGVRVMQLRVNRAI